MTPTASRPGTSVKANSLKIQGVMEKLVGRRLFTRAAFLPRRGLEPLRISPPDPKSGASANFATSALKVIFWHDFRKCQSRGAARVLRFAFCVRRGPAPSPNRPVQIRLPPNRSRPKRLTSRKYSATALARVIFGLTSILSPLTSHLSRLSPLPSHSSIPSHDLRLAIEAPGSNGYLEYNADRLLRSPSSSY
jgi:hypothetical protein